MSSHWICANVLLVLRIIARIPNSVVHVPSLPYFRGKGEFLFHFVRKTTFNELHRPFYGDAFTRREQKMDVVRHYRELVNLELFVIPIPEKRR